MEISQVVGVDPDDRVEVREDVEVVREFDHILALGFVEIVDGRVVLGVDDGKKVETADLSAVVVEVSFLG